VLNSLVVAPGGAAELKCETLAGKIWLRAAIIVEGSRELVPQPRRQPHGHETLEGHGYAVIPAAAPAEALRLAGCHAGPIHLLVTDVVMPQLSGRGLAEQLTPARRDLRVLYISGYTDDAIVRHGVLEEGTAFLQKPFPPYTLLVKVREVLDRRT
jgi:DNA-binding response OmpR family regulator